MPIPHRNGLVHLLLLFLLMGVSFDAFAQKTPPLFQQTISFQGSSQTTLPFWLTSNQFGTIDSEKESLNLRLSYLLPERETGIFTYSIGTDVVARASVNSAIFFQQLYGELGVGPFLLRAGRKEETSGEVHSSLSLGSMVISQNAAPITGVSISWPAFVTIPGTKTFLAVKGHVKHGWIDGYRVATNPWLHGKSFYLRMGSDHWKIRIWAGILHYNVWAGRHRNESIGDLPSSFNDYLRVFFVRSASESTVVEGERTNVLGNSVGAYDFGLTYRHDSFVLQAYRQFYLEDTVSMRFRSPWDGLWGFNYRKLATRHLIEEFLYEHVNTKRQGSFDFELPGTDNYYNHFIYSSGWTHRGRTLGSPLMLMRPDQVGVFNNILLAHHLGLAGSILPALRYQLQLTYTRNYGANAIFQSIQSGFTMNGARFDGPQHQYYAALSFVHAFSSRQNISAFLRLGYDWGDLSDDSNFGVSIGFKRTGLF